MERLRQDRHNRPAHVAFKNTALDELSLDFQSASCRLHQRVQPPRDRVWGIVAIINMISSNGSVRAGESLVAKMQQTCLGSASGLPKTQRGVGVERSFPA
jgi:ribosomal protein L19